MLYEDRVRNLGGFKYPGGKEHVFRVLEYLGSTLVVGTYESVDVRVDTCKFTILVPVVRIWLFRIPGKEWLHVAGSGKLLIKTVYRLAGSIHVSLWRLDLEDYIFHVPWSILPEELFVVFVVRGNLRIRNGDCGIHRIRERNQHEINIGSDIVVGDCPLEHERILNICGRDEWTVLEIVLLGVHWILYIVPINLESAGLVGSDAVDKILDSLLGELTVLIKKCRILGDERRNHVSCEKFLHFFFSYIDTCFPCLYSEEIFVDETLPCNVAYLGLLLLVLGRWACNHLIDCGKPFHILLKINIRDLLTVDHTHIVLGWHCIECCLKSTRINDERQKSQSDDDWHRQACFFASFLKYRHCSILSF